MQIKLPPVAMGYDYGSDTPNHFVDSSKIVRIRYTRQMIHRYALFEIENLSKRFEIADGVPSGTKRNYNISPAASTPVVVLRDGARQIERKLWGIIPQNAKDTSAVFRYKTHAVRSEVALKKQSLAKAIRTQRCLVPANGWYEWRVVDGQKTPYFVTVRDQPLFAMAGIYSSWTDPNGKEWGTYGVMTIDSHSSSTLGRLARPIVLHPNDEASWLDPTIDNTTELYGMMKSNTDDMLSIVQVSDRVNSTKPNTPELIAPLA